MTSCGETEDARVPEFGRFLDSESCPLALEVIVDRPRAATRGRNAPWGGPSPADVIYPVDFDEEDPRIYARQDCDAPDVAPDLCGFRDYGDIRDWTSVSLDIAGSDYPGAEVSAT